MAALALAACAQGAPSASTAPTPSSPAPSRPAAAESRADRFVDSVLALMTLEEKLGQLNQRTGPELTGPGAAATLATTEADLRAGRVGSYLNVVGAEETRRLQRLAMESRLRIPLLYGYDVIHGFRTTFPVPLAQASSWDTAGVARAARIAATEAAASGIHWTFAPMVDIARDPRWGRVVEGAGEDPYLGSAMAAAAVRGYQGTDLGADSTILATAKHFVAYGAAEGGRDYDAAEVSERTLREIYLPPFEAAVRAGAGSIMASFNEVDGVPMHANEALLRGVLRRDWGFDGLVVSDWTG
ncbi:MAG TPA: glycoside hydrolase family 3 N-terminal domain-containing protein, partial [Gemmatimonadaceae bacterium]|nr:glycoside hydrolase family 3 N-terminal domain-containing protein [Gemmatimonadaceae bacterium]